MAKLRVHNFSVSLDGYAAGPEQSRERLFDHLEGSPLGYTCAELAGSPAAAHVRLTRGLGGISRYKKRRASIRIARWLR